MGDQFSSSNINKVVSTRILMTETNQNPLFPMPYDSISDPLSPEPTAEAIDVDVETTQTDWYTLAQSLRQQNQNLLKTIVHLEQALTDAQQNLQIQSKRVRSAETLIHRQSEELNQTQDHENRFASELESSQQTIQQQQSVINHLCAELETTQKQLAYLERECALLQEDRTGKTHQLLTAQRHMQELQTRLQRQQRYTLQYKSALEQFSETEVTASSKVVPLLPKTASIQPWSNISEVKETETQDSNAWVESSEGEVKARTIEDNVVESKIENSSDGFSAELEEDKPVTQLKENPSNPQNWSFSIISSRPSWKKTPAKSVDLPTFLREQTS